MFLSSGKVVGENVLRILVVKEEMGKRLLFVRFGEGGRGIILKTTIPRKSENELCGEGELVNAGEPLRPIVGGGGAMSINRSGSVKGARYLWTFRYTEQRGGYLGKGTEGPLLRRFGEKKEESGIRKITILEITRKKGGKQNALFD